VHYFRKLTENLLLESIFEEKG